MNATKRETMAYLTTAMQTEISRLNLVIEDLRDKLNEADRKIHRLLRDNLYLQGEAMRLQEQYLRQRKQTEELCSVAQAVLDHEVKK